MTNRRSGSSDRAHDFGGNWTEVKLGILSEYLRAYTTALQNQPFTKMYIDAFAGTGYRTLESGEGRGYIQPLFPELAAPEPQALLEGSAKRALRTEPPFDQYVFIERSAERARALQDLKVEFPALANKINVVQGDANAKIQGLCRKPIWHSHRAVLFLDPYGMQVEWETIRAIAVTKAIDLWLLFPLGVAVNRLLTRSGDIPAWWAERLTTIFGTESWRSRLYETQPAPSLFVEDAEEVKVKAGIGVIAEYFLDRLRGVFAAVAENPLVLRNSTNTPLYLFCFAASNEAGAPIALRIAKHILNMERR